MSRDLSNNKCQDILTASKTLFWKHGIRRISVQEICKEAGVSKMTFYRFFDNKIDLVKTLLDSIFDKGIQDYRNIMDMKIPFPEKVKKTLLIKFQNSQDMSQELLMDMYKNQETELIEYMEKRTSQMLDIVLDDYEKAQKEGFVRPHIKRAFISYQLYKMREMALDEKLLALYKNPQELIKELTDYFFYGLLERH